jgi:glycosyltransferase involved in cell wall biosynthesis
MKSYNLHMINIVGRLRAEGYPVSWTVYGDGELRDAMKSRIDELGLNDDVQLMGQIAYSKIAEALRDAFLFVGMGTAVVEAALCGVPGIVALAYGDTDATYGPLYRFTFGNVGERMTQPPTSTIEGEIRRMLRLSESEYQQEVFVTARCAQRYETEAGMREFVALARRAAAPKPRRALYYLYYLYSSLRRVLKKAPVGASPDFYGRRERQD